MKKRINNRRKLIIILNGIAYLFLIGIIIIILNNQKLIIGKEKQLIKEMTETEQVTNLQKQLDALNDTQTEYANYIQTSKTNLATAITNAGVTTNGDDTFETMITNVSKILSNKTNDATATADNILTGQTAYVKGNKVTGTMANKGAVTASIDVGESYTIPEGYHNGSGKVTVSSLGSYYIDTFTIPTNGTSTNEIACGFLPKVVFYTFSGVGRADSITNFGGYYDNGTQKQWGNGLYDNSPHVYAMDFITVTANGFIFTNGMSSTINGYDMHFIAVQ